MYIVSNISQMEEDLEQSLLSMIPLFPLFIWMNGWHSLNASIDPTPHPAQSVVLPALRELFLVK